MSKKPWQRTRSELRTIALLQTAAAIAWWLLVLYDGPRRWFIVVAVLWTLVAIRSVVSWRRWRPLQTAPDDHHDAAPDAAM